MSHGSPFIALFAAVLPLLPAQQLTAHPQETVQNTSGNIAPLGVVGAGGFAETRCQILVPRQELPACAGPLVAVEVHGLGSGVVDYAQLEIRIAPTAATTLSATFAQNFVVTPTVVLQIGNIKLDYSGGWSRIEFKHPYVHNGSSSIVIEIRKVVRPRANQATIAMATSSQPARTDRPRMCYTTAGVRSGAANATIANTFANPIAHRLVWSGVSTLRHRSDPSGPLGNQYAIGGRVDIVLQGPVGHLWLVAAGLGYLPPGVVLPGLQGEFRLNGAVLFGGGLIDRSGVVVQLVRIPNAPALVGFFLAYQGVTVDAEAEVGRLTNAMDHFVNR